MDIKFETILDTMVKHCSTIKKIDHKYILFLWWLKQVLRCFDKKIKNIFIVYKFDMIRPKKLISFRTLVK